MVTRPHVVSRPREPKHKLTPEGLAWLREYLRDTYNQDFMSDYQLELVGVVPADVRRWADIEPLP